jgi:hypothetical protein
LDLLPDAQISETADAIIRVAKQLEIAQWIIMLWSLIPFLRWGVAPVVDALAKFRRKKDND